MIVRDLTYAHIHLITCTVCKPYALHNACFIIELSLFFRMFFLSLSLSSKCDYPRQLCTYWAWGTHSCAAWHVWPPWRGAQMIVNTGVSRAYISRRVGQNERWIQISRNSTSYILENVKERIVTCWLMPQSHHQNRHQTDNKPDQQLHYHEWPKIGRFGFGLESVWRCDWGSLTPHHLHVALFQVLMLRYLIFLLVSHTINQCNGFSVNTCTNDCGVKINIINCVQQRAEPLFPPPPPPSSPHPLLVFELPNYILVAVNYRGCLRLEWNGLYCEYAT